MTDKEKSEEITSKWWQDLIKKDNCNSTEEAIEKACLEMAEYKNTETLKKVIQFFEDNFNSFKDGGVLGVFNSKCEMIEEFKKFIKQ